MEGKISGKVLEKIKQEKIKPDPKWKFLVKDYLVWTSFGAAVFIGGIAVGSMAFVLINSDWDIYPRAGENFSEYLAMSLPFFWIIALVGVSFLSFYNYRHTKKGYRTNPFAIIGSSIVLSLALGVLFYQIGLSEKVERSISYSIPYYGRSNEYRAKVWSQPEMGLIAGTVIFLESKDNFEIEGFDGNIWIIKGDDILWRPRIIQKEGAQVKVLGETEDQKQHIFYGKEVRPWIGVYEDRKPPSPQVILEENEVERFDN
ncbi:MAG: hypothetical protein M0P97_03260 [Candidatus Moranbacteria bacterium]|jgi:hypothetical protein|nr:hypothetical protein [Candidatus Moranbacteria bacterium]